MTANSYSSGLIAYASRVATDADCACDESLERYRKGYGGGWKPAPDYHPYASAGDFSGDNVEDKAVLVVRKSSSSYPTLLIFNGPFKSQPPFVEEGVELGGTGLFFGPPNGDERNYYIDGRVRPAKGKD
jgi:hypothetical protein